MKRLKTLVLCLALLGGTLSTLADDTKPALLPVPLTGESRDRVKDAYNALLVADRDFVNAVVQAKYDMNIPKGYELDVRTMNFLPPPPRPAPAAKP